MKTSMPRSGFSLPESKQIDKQLAEGREQNKAALVSLVSIMIFGFLLAAPLYLPSQIVGIVLGVVPAIYMTWYLKKHPDSMRNRGGSLVTAFTLVAFLWFVAIATVFANVVEIVAR